jgi:hypothetical protein
MINNFTIPQQKSHISESELFKRSYFVLKIKGYTFHNFYIPKDVSMILGDTIKQGEIILDEDFLQVYRKEHFEHPRTDIAFVKIDGSVVAIVNHETGIEIFIISIASGIAASIIYDIIKKIITSFIRSIKKENERYPTDFDFNTADYC